MCKRFSASKCVFEDEVVLIKYKFIFLVCRIVFKDFMVFKKNLKLNVLNSFTVVAIIDIQRSKFLFLIIKIILICLHLLQFD